MERSCAVWREGTSGVEAFAGSWAHFATVRHAHDDYQITLVDHGIGGVLYRGVEQILPAGQMTVFNPNEIHATGSAAAVWRFRALHVPRTTFAAIARHAPGLLPRFTPATALVRAFAGLHDLVRAQRPIGEALAGLVTALAADHCEAPAVNDARQSLTSDARRYLDGHLDRQVSLAELTTRFAVSPTHLVRRFASEVGMPPHAYHLQLRVGHSRDLLRAGASPGHAALAAGFSDQSHFTRHFTRLVGMSPGRYRQAVRHGKNVQDPG